MNRDELYELIDACRPGSEDVHEPDMQALADAIARDEELERAYQATQRADVAIGKAFRDISPPEGLAARLLDNVEVARGRRRLLVWGSVLGLAIAASVAAIVIRNPFAGDIDFRDDGQRNAIVDRWSAQALGEGGWHSSSMPEDFPGPSQVSARLAGWKLVDGGRTVCYQLVVGRNQTAFLFVSKQSTAGLLTGPTLPAATAYRAPYLSAAWASKGHVYVLAVPGNDGSARRLFQEIITVQAA
ncbi:MAG: hypothetical protein CMJ64_29730 [Planctomycetaceae bacterium]|jgi:hypothetical protein|nr:hypothetical protein [Planctomycetaceae bacterium]